MPDLSVKGIARRYRGRSAPFSLRDTFGIASGGGGIAFLRATLESIAREEHSFDYVEDCNDHGFGGTARFMQTWTHIVIRINLVFDNAIPITTRDNLMATWRDTIQEFWSLKWGCAADGETTSRLTFEVQWTSVNPHHTITVIVGPARSNSGRWDTNDTGAVAAHEFGHLLGLRDEYTPDDPAECPIRNPVNTGTVMDTNIECFPARLMTRFAENIGSQIVTIAEHTHNPALCT